MNKPLVYLCGTITKEPRHLEWREDAEEYLALHGIGVLSPVRNKDPEDWTEGGLDGRVGAVYAGGAFVERDERDLKICDAVLLYFPAHACPTRQSIGTWAEFGLAALAGGLGKPVVVVTDLPEVARHPFIYRRAAKITSSFDEALEYLVFLLGGESSGRP